jgi:polyisoprenoid-binding protein YceI
MKENRMRPFARTAASLFASLLLLAPLSPSPRAQTPAGAAFSVDTAASSVSYKIVHKLHTVVGTSKSPTGKARILPDGKVQVMVTIPVQTFDSGNSQRDAHVKEVLAAAAYADVSLKAVGEGVTVPTSFPTTIEKTFKGELTFHGERKTLEIPVKLVFESATRVTATTTFQISLEAYKVERPSLLLVKVDDAAKIEVSLVFKA